MNDSGWYEVTQGPVLHQGDILFRCPAFSVVPKLTWPIPEGAPLDIDFVDLDVVVLTQGERIKLSLRSRLRPGFLREKPCPGPLLSASARYSFCWGSA